MVYKRDMLFNPYCRHCVYLVCASSVWERTKLMSSNLVQGLRHFENINKQTGVFDTNSKLCVISFLTETPKTVTMWITPLFLFDSVYLRQFLQKVSISTTTAAHAQQEVRFGHQEKNFHIFFLGKELFLFENYISLDHVVALESF